MTISRFLDSRLPLAIFVLLGMCVVILTALGFQHLGGYIPCKLCLGQREPWYLGIPVMMLASLSAFCRWPECLTRGMLLVGGLLMTYSLALAVHHSGVEWQWWAGPTDCAATAGGMTITNAEDLLGQLDSVKPPACDTAAGRFLGLSFAGWNAVASVVLAGLAMRSAFLKPQ